MDGGYEPPGLVDLPSELKIGEVGSSLSFDDLLSFCSINREIKTQCKELALLEKRLAQMNYHELTAAVLRWAWRGLQTDLLIDLLPSLVDRLDLYTVQMIYFYLLEQNKDVSRLRELMLPLLETDRYYWLVGASNWFSQSNKGYKTAQNLIDAIKTDKGPAIVRLLLVEMVKELSILNRSEYDSPPRISSRYVAHLLSNSLNDEEIALLLRKINKEMNGQLANFFAFFYAQLVNTDRKIRGFDLNLLYENIRSPLRLLMTKEQLITNILSMPTDMIYIYPFLMLTPEEFAETIAQRTKEGFTNRQHYFTILYSFANENGYNVWYDQAIHILKTKYGIDVNG